MLVEFHVTSHQIQALTLAEKLSVHIKSKTFFKPKSHFFLRGLLYAFKYFSKEAKEGKTKLCGLEFYALVWKVDLQRSLLRRNWKVLLSRRIEVVLERSVFSRCAFDPKTETRRLNKPWSKYRKRQMTTTLGGFDNTFVIYWEKRKW